MQPDLPRLARHLQLDPCIGQYGIMLSGGQRQRIGIARALYGHTQLLILDEATSALDAENEQLVQSGIDRLLMQENSNTTVLLIAHRLSTVINSDQIAVIHEGQIRELGTHSELCAHIGYR